MKRAVALALLFSLLLSGCTGTKAPEKKQYTATFLTLFDTVTSIVGRAESQEELMEKLKTEAKVGMNSGATYGEEGVGFARLNIGCPKFLLEKAMNQIKAAFDK